MKNKKVLILRVLFEKISSRKIQLRSYGATLDKGGMIGLIHRLRFHTTFRLHHKLTRFRVYKKWADYRYSHHIHVATAVITLLAVIIANLLPAGPQNQLFAAAGSWSQTTFNGTSDGAYTSTQALNSNADVGLSYKSDLSNAGGGGWANKRPITITNGSGSAQTDYQVPIQPFNDATNGNQAGYRYESGLQGSWHLNEGSGTTTADMSGNSKTGSLSGTNYWTASGRFGAALDASGDDYVTTTTASTLGVVNAFTIEAWSKFSGLVNSSYYTLFETKASGDSNNRILLEYGDGTNAGRLVAYVYNSAGTQFKQYRSTASNLNDNTWRHISVTWDGTNLRLYFNGSEDTTLTKTTDNAGTMTDTSRIINFGSRVDASNKYVGQIDEVKMYSRALSATEITNRYNSNTPKIRHDYQDLRFTKTDGTELPYWQETDGKYWVKYSGSLATGNTNINMYYGNAGAGNSSSYSNTATASSTSYSYNGQSGLQAEWRLEEASGITANDTSGNGKNGTLANGATRAGGKYGQALSLDGNTQYMSTPLDAPNPVSVSIWYKNTSTSAYIVQRWGSLYLSAGSTSVSWSIYNGSTFGTAASCSGLSQNQWYHVVAIYDGSQYLLYVNSALCGRGSNSGNYTPLGPLGVGIRSDASFGDSPPGFGGLLDDIRMYNRALSQSEITPQYLGQKYLGTPPTHAAPGAEAGAYVASGTYVTNAIAPTGLYGNWGALTYTRTLSGQTLTIDVLDSGNNVITGCGGTCSNVASGTNIAASTSTYPSLKLRANLSGDNSNTPTLNDWAVAYTYDITAPTGTTLSWSTVTSTSIDIIASGAADSESGLRGDNLTYYIERDNNATSFVTADTNSGWISGDWPQSGLSPNTAYAYRVKARDSLGNESSWVNPSPVYKYTLIETPTGATFSGVTVSAITTASTNTPSNLAVGSSGIYFRESVTGTNSGWITTNSWPKSGLTADKQYTFYITTRNGDGTANAEVGPYTKYTLAIAPNVTGDKSVSTWYSTSGVVFTNVAGFGDGGVSYYRYVWDQTPTHTWTDTETQWNASTLPRTMASGNNYLHIKGYNGEDVSSGTADYGPYQYDNTAPTGTALSWGTIGTTSINITASGASDSQSGLRGDGLTYYIERDDNATTFVTADANSGWVTGAWNQSSLSANTAYAYRVKARDNVGNESGWVTPSPAYKYTLIETPTGATFSGVTVSSITTASTNTPSNLTSGSSGIYFRESVTATNSGWITTNSWPKSSLTANKQYSFYITTRNGDGTANSEVGPYTKYTLAVDPNVTADKSVSTWYNTSGVIFTNAAGFGDGGVAKYKYVWDQTPTHSFSGDGTDWTSGTLSRTMSSGDNYLHTQAYNGDNMAGNTADYGPYQYDNTAPAGTTLSWGAITNTTISITASGAADSQSGLRGDSLTYYIERDNNATSFVTADTNSGWISGAWNQGSLTPNTPYAYRVKARDNVGNESSWLTPTPAYKYTLANAPVLNAMPYANTNKPAVSNSSTPDTSFANRTIRLYNGGVFKASTTANGSGVFTFAPGDWSGTLDEGNGNSVTVTALNGDGEESAASGAIVIHVDTINPTEADAASAWTDTGKGTALADNVWNGHNNGNSVYFEWSGAADLPPLTASGIKRYHVYFGSNGSADPSVDGTPTLDATASATRVLSSPVSGTDYYFRVMTEDNATNKSSAVTLFTYKYDNTNPNPVAYVMPNPSGWGTDPYTFTWPAGTDTHSGVQGYEYARDNGEAWTYTGSLSVAGINHYQSGVNIFKVRVLDRAGNYSTVVNTNYYYTGAVGEPTNLAADLSQSVGQTVNMFKFTWDPPVGVTPQGYYYSVNAAPSPSNSTYTTNGFTGFYAAATQQGLNTFYVVAKDEFGNIGWSTPASVAFSCNTVAPDVPAGMKITDASDRGTANWALTVGWTALTGQPPDFNGYSVYRCTTGCGNDANYSKVADVTTNIYSEAGLSNVTDYYYKVKSKDNIGNTSALSAGVHRIPTGKYTTPPTYTSGPTAIAKATSVTVSWSTNRVSNTVVQYGTTTSYGQEASKSTEAVTSHTIDILGLSPGTTYHYRVQSLDADRDYDPATAYSGDFTFTTSAAPGISNVEISEIRLASSIVSWKTTSSATSKILYGTTTSYGQTYTDQSSSQTTTHTVKLTGLSDSTTYNFKIQGVDIEGNVLNSDNYVFTTLTFPKLSNLKVSQVPNTPTSTVEVSFDSNVPTSSLVTVSGNGGKDTAKYDLETTHKVKVTGLQDDTQYTISVKGRDQYGNEANPISTSYKTEFDTRPPLVTDITTETSITGYGTDARGQIVVSWNTDEPGTSQVEYSSGVAGTDYTSKTQEDTSLTESHVVIISDLKPSAPYHFRVVSKDKAGNTGKSGDNAVLTQQASESILDLIIKSLQSTIGWIFNVFARK